MATKVVTPNMKKVKRFKEEPDVSSVIPKFGYKSAFIIALTAALSCFFLPNMLSILGLDTRITTLISNAIFISLAVCYCHFFIETKKGFSKSFIKLYVGFFIATGIISYFWLYVGLYM